MYMLYLLLVFSGGGNLGAGCFLSCSFHVVFRFWSMPQAFSFSLVFILALARAQAPSAEPLLFSFLDSQISELSVILFCTGAAMGDYLLLLSMILGSRNASWSE